MIQYRFPTRRLGVAFIGIQAILMLVVAICYQYMDIGTAVSLTVKMIGQSSVLLFMWHQFRRNLWRKGMFRTIGLVDFPDINGVWNSTIKYKGYSAPIKGKAYITQTYTGISIRHEGIISDSYSISASLARDDEDAGNFFLIMTVQNNVIKALSSSQEAAGHMEHKDHRATLVLAIRTPPTVMEGRIWSDDLSAESNASHPSFGHVLLSKVR